MSDFQQAPIDGNKTQQHTGTKLLLIALSIITCLIIVVGCCVAFVMYQNSQTAMRNAQLAQERAEEDRKALQRIQAEAERKMEAERLAREEERLAREEAERKAEEERLAREAEERAAREEQERIAREEEARKPRGEVISIDSKGDWEFVNGEMDAGFKVTTVIKNNGPAGDLKVVAFLSCSQGEWVRTQHLFFRAGESMTLRYFFHEPTISVTSCQARAVVSP